jgi:hypothetical protein
MSDPTALLDALTTAEDAFAHAAGDPLFEPGLDASPDAADGAVQIGKACRLLELAHRIEELGPYYGAILEASFIAIEHTIQGYLLALTGVEDHELRDHDRPYELARGQVPLKEATIDRLERLYDARRTDHYYGTTVTTEQQATALRDVATAVHEHVVGFEGEVARLCTCSEGFS